MKTIGAYRIRTICAQEGYNVRVIDHGQLLDVEKIVAICDALITKDTFFISLSKTFLTEFDILTNFENAFSIVKKKFPNIKFIVGGAGEYIPKIKMPPWDFRMVGFSELSFVDLLKYLSGKINSIEHQIIFKGSMTNIYGKNYSTNYDMKTLGTVWLPEDDIRSTDSLPIEISRGCIFKCDFCSYELNGKKKFDYFRLKSSLVHELQYNKEQFGVTNYVFLDDTFNDSRQKIKLIDDVLSELDFKITYETFIKPELLATFPETAEQMVNQGLISCTMGVESLYPKTRKAIHKGKDYYKFEEYINKLKNNDRNWNVGIHYTMILGLPYEPIESMRKTFEQFHSSDMVDDHSWQPLFMTNGKGDDSSKIERNPNNYGYRVYEDPEVMAKKLDGLPKKLLSLLGRHDNPLLYWENDQTDFKEVVSIAGEFLKEYRPKQILSGLGTVAQARCLGYENIQGENGLNKIYLEDVRKFAYNPKFFDRADEYFNNILGRIYN